jgi:hypothetical protein
MQPTYQRSSKMNNEQVPLKGENYVSQPSKWGAQHLASKFIMIDSVQFFCNDIK